MTSIRVSIVVPTYRRPGYLERCLMALIALDFAPGEYEVIIADDAALPETRKQVEGWAQRVSASGHTVRYIALEGKRRAHGPAAARNAGWHAAVGEIIAFTDRGSGLSGRCDGGRGPGDCSAASPPDRL